MKLCDRTATSFVILHPNGVRLPSIQIERNRAIQRGSVVRPIIDNELASDPNTDTVVGIRM